ncbi:MAG: ABC transporter ATP-binding protein [Pseudonocardiaceae bacterium]
MTARVLGATLRPHRRKIVFILLLQLVQSVSVLVMPALSARIIDIGVDRGDPRAVTVLGSAILLLAAVQLACTVQAVRLGSRVAMEAGRDLREKVFGRTLALPRDEVDSFGVAGLVARTTNDVQQVQLLVLTTLTLFLPAPFVAVGSAVMALQQDTVVYSLLLAVLIPIFGVGLGLILGCTQPQARAQQSALDTVGRVLREQIGGARPIRAFVQENRVREEFERHNLALRGSAIRVGRLNTTLLPFVTTTINLMTVPAVWFAAGRIGTGTMTVGALTAVITYLLFVQAAVMTATSTLMTVPRARVCLGRISEVLDTPQTPGSVAAPPRPVHVPERGRVELRAVGYRYPGAAESVLDCLDLIAEPGRVTALTGPTGSGKSTVLRLVAGLVRPTSGRVMVDGVEVDSIAPEARARIIGLVPQEPYLFAGTVRSNLSLAGPADDDELWEALGIAQATSFVERLPEGLDAPVSQGGANFSGGQRQRLAIARALVGRPLVYLLDDASSALDQATDAAIRGAMARERPEATVLSVSQRIGSVAGAERITVLDRGRVAGTGTHTELLQACPMYREFAASQLIEECASA